MVISNDKGLRRTTDKLRRRAEEQLNVQAPEQLSSLTEEAQRLVSELEAHQIELGTGIGLFMSNTIIEKNMGGTLTVRNTGSGAEFRIAV